MTDSRAMALEIRRHAVRMANAGGSSHIGSVLSCADALAVLYSGVLRIDPANPQWDDRDRFILSKGHAGSGIYAALALAGFIDPDVLKTHYQDGSILSGHVSHKGVAGVEISTGSLGHGLSIGAGMAYAAKLQGKSWRAFVMLSDGECDEGSIWEAVLFAAHHRLDNLVAVVDYNKIQSLAPVAETLGLEPFADKWRAFGWNVAQIDGHDHDAVRAAFVAIPAGDERPTCVILDTVKGKGVSFMEHTVLWHYRTPRGDEFDAALAELDVASERSERASGAERAAKRVSASDAVGESEWRSPSDLK
jgi:transketolase